MPKIHIIGAGLAGLAAATRLSRLVSAAGCRLVVYEAAGHAGGRCRSFYEASLQRQIDNGNHLMLGANHALWKYLDDLAPGMELATHAQIAQLPMEFPFVDVKNGTAWCIRPGQGILPAWIFDPQRIVPEGSAVRLLVDLFRLLFAREAHTVLDRVTAFSPLYRKLWEPLCLAIMNLPPSEASAKLFAKVLRRSLLKGGRYCQPFIATKGLSALLVDPALRRLEEWGAEIRFHRRLKELQFSDNATLSALHFSDGVVGVEPQDQVVLAVPWGSAERLIPNSDYSLGSAAIYNLHFALPPCAASKKPELLGMVGTMAQWVFIHSGLLSVTISAADRLGLEMDEDRIGSLVWGEVVAGLRLAGKSAYLDGLVAATPPPFRVIREKRATFMASPDHILKRPMPATRSPNLWLAGDWTATGLPATIEGAIESGHRAANRVCHQIKNA